jgi:hypothetical protein
MILDIQPRPWRPEKFFERIPNSIDEWLDQCGKRCDEWLAPHRYLGL